MKTSDYVTVTMSIEDFSDLRVYPREGKDRGHITIAGRKLVIHTNIKALETLLQRGFEAVIGEGGFDIETEEREG